jgi:hypothetical protein
VSPCVASTWVTDFPAHQLPACVLDLVSAVDQRRLPVITVCAEPAGHAGNGQARNAEQIVGRRASRRRQDWATHAVGSHYPRPMPLRADLAELADWVEGLSAAAHKARDGGNITLAEGV